MIDKFERRNNLSVNVYSHEGGHSSVLYAKEQRDKVVNLFLVLGKDFNHYTAIVNNLVAW